jgi:hypothetical protein
MVFAARKLISDKYAAATILSSFNHLHKPATHLHVYTAVEILGSASKDSS